MAKELPYFKFFCSEWNDGDITLESYETQGLFINVCSYYWSNNCDVSISKLKKKFKEDLLIDCLVKEGLIKIESGLVVINFLIEQLGERDNLSNQNSINAKKRWDDIRLSKRLECESNATASDSQCDNSTESMQYREEKRREEKIREDKENSFNSWWDLYDNKKGLSKSKTRFLKLSDSDIKLILEVTPIYVKSTPDVKYRKLPLTWLNGEHWNDDFTTKKKKFINPCY